MKVSLKWITPDADKMVAHMARVSNPNAKEDDPSEKLIRYLLDHKHFSPFEMACMCVEIETTRDIARQILRHRSFHFQEFSQRYAKMDSDPVLREARMQDPKNRQNSIELKDCLSLDDEDSTNFMWKKSQYAIYDQAIAHYNQALELGIAKEVARALLPEGLTPTRLYMQGTLRDWLHYVGIREGRETQYEHRQIAQAVRKVLEHNAPVILEAARQAGIILEGGPDDHASEGDRR